MTCNMAKKYHNKRLPYALENYADSRTLEFYRYSAYHMRIIDDGYTIVDLWTTEKYWIKETNYYKQSDKSVVERANETGFLPSKKGELYKFLDGIFYATET